MRFSKRENKGTFKNYSWWQRYFYPVISSIFLLFLLFFLAYSIFFLAKELNQSFKYSTKQTNIHFNLDGLKEIENKLPSK